MLEAGRLRAREERGLVESCGRFLQEVGFGCRERCLKYLTAGLRRLRSPAERRELLPEAPLLSRRLDLRVRWGGVGHWCSRQTVEKDPPPAHAA